jgi:NADP-dependent 3-hydroxy acid dehydrogenase YdfG
MEIQDRVFIVTGASSGIELSTARSDCTAPQSRIRCLCR